MFVYEKKLQYPVRIKNTNPKLASIIISQYGGPNGELGAALRYLSQRYSMPFDEQRGLLTDIGTEELGHLEMVGTIVRDKYAAKAAADGRTTYHIAIMPCTAKKMEAARPEFIHDGRPDVDLVLTTREVIDMMQETGIQLGELELESPDLPFGLGSGAAVIYGTSGGVAEAVVRHCLPDKSKNALREISILGLRGDAPIKEASVTIGDTELKLAVVNGLANAKKLLKEIDEGKKFYHLIEVMTCQGGCVGGAGQPYGLKKSKEKRGDGLHLSDNAAMFKRAERNPVVAQMMAEYGEERCHELLHVTYTNK